MAPPLTPTAERLYDAVRPLAYDDEAQGWALAHLCGAIACMFDRVADLTRDTLDGRAGWATLGDPDAAPAEWLAWTGQFVGVDVPAYLEEAAKRLRIKETAGFKRGTPDAVRGAARQHLAGGGTVFLTERHGSAYRLTVTTYTGETPDAARVLAALREQKPGGLILTHSVVPGGDFATLRDTHSSFADVLATFASFDEVRSNPAKQ